MYKLLSLGADINAKDSYNKTSLIYALEYCKDSEVIFKLIELGAVTQVFDAIQQKQLKEICSQSC